jgi:hypothetical protein
MRILFLIGYFNKNNGGHFHSLYHIANEIATQHEVRIVSIGSFLETIVNTNNNYHKHIDFNGKNFLHLFKNLKEIKKDFSPEIVHSFGKHGYDLWKLMFGKQNVGMVVNLCGGPNPKVFPKVENLILFSKENLQWFENQPKYNNTKKYLIPNRVSEVQLSIEQSIQKNPKRFSFVRISRIGTYYKKSLADTINLIKKLQADNIECELFIIGFIEDKDIYNELLNLSLNAKNIHFLTEKSHTDKASKMLYLADAVVATGRSFMEAASLGVPVLTPIKASEIPLLVTANNFDEVFKTNFSERNIVSDSWEAINYENIKNCILSQEDYRNASNFAKTIFDEYFDLKKAKTLYEKVYLDAISQPIKFGRWDNLKSIMNSIYKSLKYYKKING